MITLNIENDITIELNDIYCEIENGRRIYCCVGFLVQKFKSQNKQYLESEQCSVN